MLIFLPDFFEVAILLGTCFIVNYVTADAKTNWVEGYAMVSFYTMIVRMKIFYSNNRTHLALFCTAGTVLLVLSWPARNCVHDLL
jgi:Ca2+:H+ antiporter